MRGDATADQVWTALGPSARAAVSAARAHRAQLASLPILRQLRVGMPAAEARALGVEVLREDREGVMCVGMFEVPRLDPSLVDPPKSERPRLFRLHPPCF